MEFENKSYVDHLDHLSTIYLEKDTYTDFQRLLHDTSDPDEDIPSRFFVEIRKTSWSTLIPAPLTRNQDSDNYIYTPDPKMDYLMYTYLLAYLPNVKVKPKFHGQIEIRWCYNLFHNIIIQGLLSYGENPVSKITDKWLDIHSQFFMKNETGKPQLYDFIIGNYNLLQNWTNDLPAWPIGCPQPWPYSEHDRQAVPLFLCPMSRPVHRYKFRLKIKDLIQMRIREDENSPWQYVACKTSALQDIDDKTEIKPPVMWGKYSNMSEKEKDWHKTWPHEMLASTTLIFKTDNKYPSGSSVPIPVRSQTPIKAFYWVAEHLDALAINNYSNYTTNPYLATSGWNPIKRMITSYNKRVVLSLDGIQTDQMEAWYHANSAPRRFGYGSHSKSYRPGGLQADVGLVYGSSLDAEFTFILDSTDPRQRHLSQKPNNDETTIQELLESSLRKDIYPEQEKKDYFYIYLFALTFNILTFKHGHPVDVNDGSEKNKYLSDYQNNFVSHDNAASV